jgi:hypothetical protein
MRAREEEKIKKMVKFRTVLEGRIQDLETELDGLKVLLGFLDDMLLEGGFRRATIVKPDGSSTPGIPSSSEVVPSPSSDTPLTTKVGVLLANLIIDDGSLRVVLADGVAFHRHTPPFTSFFVDRVLKKMQEKDREAIRSGSMPPENMLTYHIDYEGELIQEITIRNVSEERLRELKSTVRWTLEKMHEKSVVNT